MRGRDVQLDWHKRSHTCSPSSHLLQLQYWYIISDGHFQTETGLSFTEAVADQCTLISLCPNRAVYVSRQRLRVTSSVSILFFSVKPSGQTQDLKLSAVLSGRVVCVCVCVCRLQSIHWWICCTNILIIVCVINHHDWRHVRVCAWHVSVSCVCVGCVSDLVWVPVCLCVCQWPCVQRVKPLCVTRNKDKTAKLQI